MAFGNSTPTDDVEYAFRATQYSVSDIGYLSAPTRTYTSIGFELLIDGVNVREGAGPHFVISDYEFDERQPHIAASLPEPYELWIDTDIWHPGGQQSSTLTADAEHSTANPIEVELLASHVLAHQHELIALFHRVEAMRAIALGETISFRGPREWTVPIPTLDELNAWASQLARQE